MGLKRVHRFFFLFFRFRPIFQSKVGEYALRGSIQFVKNGGLFCNELHNRGFNIFTLVELCAIEAVDVDRRSGPLSERGKNSLFFFYISAVTQYTPVR